MSDYVTRGLMALDGPEGRMPRRTVLRYRWHPVLKRWEFYGHGRPLWRQSLCYSAQFPPHDRYIVSYEDTKHELTEMDAIDLQHQLSE